MDIQTNNTYESRFSSSIIEKLYLNEARADFHFLFKTNNGEYDRVPAHKLLLAESDVFETMFNGDWKEINEVELVDASAAVFKEFLQFFYLSKVNITPENVGFVMNLGNKYDVQECLSVCGKYLMNSITNDNVCTAYGLATLFNQEKLKRYCELVIGTSAEAVLSSNGFLECDRKVLKCILDLDCIACSEVDVFKACMNWVKFKSGEDNLTREIVQEQLGILFYEFRFKSMSPREFAMILPTYLGIFTAQEYVEANQLVAVDEHRAVLFSGKRRIDNIVNDGTFDRMEILCDRLISRYGSRKPYKIKETEVTTFSVSEPVLLEQIACSKIYEYKNSGYHHWLGYLATEMRIIQVSEQFGEQILCTQKSELGSQQRTVISLSKPILIRPNLMYEIRLKQSPPDNCSTGSMLKSDVYVDSNLTVTFHRDAMADGCPVARGLVCKLHFKKI